MKIDLKGPMESIAQQQLTKKMRTGAYVNVYLILQKGGHVLLHLRKNTGYGDGYYGLISGHVEDHESAVEAMVREAKEEAGIQIDRSDLNFIHLLHRQSNRFNIDIFFQCQTWEGVVSNKEPEKCEHLEYFPIQDLPSNTLDYILEVLRDIERGKLYSEKGWASAEMVQA